MAEDKSRLRQQLGQLEDERDSKIELVLNERGPLVRGSLGKRSRVCGKPSCRCSRGERHISTALSVAVGGATQQFHVPEGDVAEVQRKAERYQRFRQARARLAELAAEQLELVDRLGTSLLEPYPKNEPIKPAGRRGRRAAKGEHDDDNDSR